MTRRPRLALILIAFVLAAAIAPIFVAIFAQSPATLNPANPFKPTPCTPLEKLHGKDTLFALLPCNDIAVLEPSFRPVVECTLARMKAGGWDAVLYETYRSDTRQRFLYSYGRTRPGHKVTNAKTARTSAHGTANAVDIIHRTRGWEHPKFFHWLAVHADACGAEVGAYWKSFPDQPHAQSRLWRKVAAGTTSQHATRVTRAPHPGYASLHRGSYETSPHFEPARAVAGAGGRRLQSGSRSASTATRGDRAGGARQRAHVGAARRDDDRAAGRRFAGDTARRHALGRVPRPVHRFGGDRLPSDRATRPVRYAANSPYVGRLAGTIPTSERWRTDGPLAARDLVPIVTREDRR